jgi:hypothetical protein
MSKKAPVSPDSILKDHTPHVQAIAEKLRMLIKNALPNIIEKGYGGWHGIGYTHPTAGYMCCIFPYANQVKLAFEYGAFLPDPDHLLAVPLTSGKQVRYLEFNSEADIREDDIVTFLHAAVAFRNR